MRFAAVSKSFQDVVGRSQFDAGLFRLREPVHGYLGQDILERADAIRCKLHPILSVLGI